MDKKEMLDIIDQTQQILARQDFSKTAVYQDGNVLKQKMEEFRPRILLAGQFSSGKTALLNTLLGGKEILKENITPQTAVAAELCYGKPEVIERVFKDGRKEEVPLAEADASPAGDCEKYIYVLDNDALREFSDCILVDMPGFDSGIEAHNRALLQYAGKAAAYIFVIDVKKGTLSSSAEKFLSELKQYTPLIRFVISKCDEVPSSQAKEIKTSIQEDLTAIMGETPDIILFSSREPDGQAVIASLLRSLPKNEMLFHQFYDPLQEFLGDVVQTLTVKEKSLVFQPHEFDAAIQEIQERKEKFQDQLQHEKKKLHNRLLHQFIPQVVSDVQQALMDKSERLAKIAVYNGTESFKTALNNIIRPVLMESAGKNLVLEFDEFTASIQKNLENDGEHSDTAGLAAHVVEQSLERIAKRSRHFAAAHRMKQLYRITSTFLSVLTDIIAPWLELLMIFLPDILGFIGKLFGTSPEEQVREKIEQQMVPQICEKLRTEMQGSVDEIEKEMAGEIEKRFGQLIAREKEALEKTEEERQQKKMDIQQQKDSISRDTQMVEGFIAEMQKAAEA